MLKAKKKISKKIIKEDTVVTTYFKAQSWYDENKKRLSTIGGVVIVLVVALWFYSNNVHANNERATTDLAKIFTFYDNGQYLIAVNGIPEKNIAGLQAIVDNYGSTHVGNMAEFYLANAYYNLQDYDKALEHFKGYNGGSALLEISASAGMGACYEAKQDFKKAAEYFEKAALKNSDDPNAPDNLVNAARNFGRSGEKERAVELLKKVKKDYPSSTAAREADRYIAEVSV